MWTGIRVQARVGDDQPLHRTIAQDMRGNDLLQVSFCDAAIPYCLRVHHHRRTMLTLIQASRFIGPDCIPHPMLCQLLLERFLQLTLRRRIAGTAWMTFRTCVSTNEYVLVELRHYFRLQQGKKSAD